VKDFLSQELNYQDFVVLGRRSGQIGQLQIGIVCDPNIKWGEHKEELVMVHSLENWAFSRNGYVAKTKPGPTYSNRLLRVDPNLVPEQARVVLRDQYRKYLTREDKKFEKSRDLSLEQQIAEDVRDV
jgi:hypothetical protein